MLPLPNPVQPSKQHFERLKPAGAVLSRDRTYRYRLWRTWSDGPRLGWIRLNPSQPDARVDDPTLRRCVGFSSSSPRFYDRPLAQPRPWAEYPPVATWL
jgi:Protein of unknown function (DUF1643)